MLLIAIGQIKKKGLVYYFLADPQQAINSINVGANETLSLQKIRDNLQRLGVSKEIIRCLDELINAIHTEMISVLKELEEN